MNTRAAGVDQCRATSGERPTMATTWSSSPASWIVARKNGNVSIRPVRSSTTVGSCHSHPSWFSSEPRWWSTANTIVPASLAAAPSHTVDRPQYEPTSTNGAPGTAAAAARAAACSASPSSGGMKPFAASACRRHSSVTAPSVGSNSVDSPCGHVVT